MKLKRAHWLIAVGLAVAIVAAYYFARRHAQTAQSLVPGVGRIPGTGAPEVTTAGGVVTGGLPATVGAPYDALVSGLDPYDTHRPPNTPGPRPPIGHPPGIIGDPPIPTFVWPGKRPPPILPQPPVDGPGGIPIFFAPTAAPHMAPGQGAGSSWPPSPTIGPHHYASPVVH